MGTMTNRYTEQASDELKESLWSAPDIATELAILAWIERQGWLHKVVSDYYPGEVVAVSFCKGQWWCITTDHPGMSLSDASDKATRLYVAGGGE